MHTFNLPTEPESPTPEGFQQYLWNLYLKNLKNELSKKQLDLLIESFSKEEEKENSVKLVIMSPDSWSWFRKTGKDTFEFNTKQITLVLGKMAMAWGATFIVDRKCQPNEVEVYSDTDMELLKEKYPTIYENYHKILEIEK